MRVSHGSNPYAYQQQRTNTKHTGFADMLAGMAANKSREDRAEKHGDGNSNHMGIANLNMRLANPHRFHGTQIKPTAEQLAVAEENNTVEPARVVLQVHEACTAELVECKTPAPKYPASIYDIPESELQAEIAAAQKACSALDKEGLSKAELYNQIESIFNDYLGKDFKDTYILYSGAVGRERGSHSGKVSGVYFTFREELSKAGINPDDSSAIIREAKGYTGMSESEMRAAVRGKYPETMTLKDCILMADELWHLGLEENNYANCVKDRIISTINLDTNKFRTQVEDMYNSMLEMPANYDTIKTSYDSFAKNDYTSYPANNMDNVFSDLLSFFGGNEFGGGEMLNRLRAMLDEMEKSGILGFDKYGYCGAINNL